MKTYSGGAGADKGEEATVFRCSGIFPKYRKNAGEGTDFILVAVFGGCL